MGNVVKKKISLEKLEGDSSRIFVHCGLKEGSMMIREALAFRVDDSFVLYDPTKFEFGNYRPPFGVFGLAYSLKSAEEKIVSYLEKMANEDIEGDYELVDRVRRTT